MCINRKNRAEKEGWGLVVDDGKKASRVSLNYKKAVSFLALASKELLEMTCLPKKLTHHAELIFQFVESTRIRASVSCSYTRTILKYLMKTHHPRNLY